MWYWTRLLALTFSKWYFSDFTKPKTCSFGVIKLVQRLFFPLKVPVNISLKKQTNIQKIRNPTLTLYLSRWSRFFTLQLCKRQKQRWGEGRWRAAELWEDRRRKRERKLRSEGKRNPVIISDVYLGNLMTSTDTTCMQLHPPTTITPPHPPSRCILRSSPSPSPSVLLHERRWCQIQYFTARIGAMTWTIWPVSSLQHWTWCYDYTLHCRSDMPRMKRGGGLGGVELLKELLEESCSPSCYVLIKQTRADRPPERRRGRRWFPETFSFLPSRPWRPAFVSVSKRPPTHRHKAEDVFLECPSEHISLKQPEGKWSQNIYSFILVVLF